MKGPRKAGLFSKLVGSPLPTSARADELRLHPG